MERDISTTIRRLNLEGDERWRDWVGRIPPITLPQASIKPIPAFAGAMVRFQAIADKAVVSVYLDVNNSLGYWVNDNGVPEPYWEVYPYDDDTFRCALDDVETLQAAIMKSLSDQRTEQEVDG